jgi:hypothetical protein
VADTQLALQATVDRLYDRLDSLDETAAEVASEAVIHPFLLRGA